MLERYVVGTCPLCSGFSKLVPNSKTIVHGNTVKTCYVECKQCHCRGPRFILTDFKTPSAARRKAVDCWNMRSLPNYTVCYMEVDE